MEYFSFYILFFIVGSIALYCFYFKLFSEKENIPNASVIHFNSLYVMEYSI